MKEHPSYAAITILILTILFLFQLFGMSLWLFDSKYETNQNAKEKAVQKISQTEESPSGKYIAVLDQSGTAPLYGVLDACSYLKRSCVTFTSLDEINSDLTDMLVVIGNQIDSSEEINFLSQMNLIGVPIVFSGLPATEFISAQSKLADLMGVRKIVSSSQQLDAVELFSGFLLGSNMTYRELMPVVPYFLLKPGYEVYMTGLLDDQKKLGIRNEDLPPVIWRFSTNTGQVFIFNGDYLSRHDDVGFFYGVLANLTNNFVYPVINAQTVDFLNFPFLSSENDAEMFARYDQRSDQLVSNVVLSQVVSSLYSSDNKLSAFFSSGFDFQSLNGQVMDPEMLRMYLRVIVGQKGEMGLSGYEYSGKYGMEKLSHDVYLLNNMIPGYSVVSFSTGGMPEETYLPQLSPGGLLEKIRTVLVPLTEGDDIAGVSFLTDNAVRIPVTSNGYSHTDEEDLSMRSMETALGYSSISVDMKKLVYPESEEDDWTEMGKGWSKNAVTYWKPFKAFNRVTISEAGNAARTFLNLDYKVSSSENGVWIRINNFKNAAYFILKTNDCRIKTISHAESKPIQKGIYLIKAEDSVVSITVQKNQVLSVSGSGVQ